MHAEGRYSDRTLMAISRWSQRSHDHILDDRYPENPARMFSISREVGYDEDTEVKSGGTIALAVTLPNEQGTNKLVMAVSRDARREGYGRRLLERVSDYAHGVHAWVGNRNVCGQQFLLNVGMFPVSMNARQAVLYAFANLPEDEGVAL
jgi:GNAT superfamily N-acetyltransferase